VAEAERWPPLPRIRASEKVAMVEEEGLLGLELPGSFKVRGEGGPAAEVGRTTFGGGGFEGEDEGVAIARGSETSKHIQMGMRNRAI